MNKGLKTKIIELRNEGLSYLKIKETLNCSLNTISYHLSDATKIKNAQNSKKYRKSVDDFYYRLRNFDKKIKKKNKNYTGNNTPAIDLYKQLKEKIGENPVCYLTGRNIDLKNRSSYELDHVFPISKGGLNTIENIEIVAKEANQCKHNMILEDFLNICGEILTKHGYEINKKLGDVKSLEDKII